MKYILLLTMGILGLGLLACQQEKDAQHENHLSSTPTKKGSTCVRMDDMKRTKAIIMKNVFDFGVVKGEKVISFSIEISNQGPTPFIIQRAKSMFPGFDLQWDKKPIESGKNASIWGQLHLPKGFGHFDKTIEIDGNFRGETKRRVRVQGFIL